MFDDGGLAGPLLTEHDDRLSSRSGTQQGLEPTQKLVSSEEHLRSVDRPSLRKGCIRVLQELELLVAIEPHGPGMVRRVLVLAETTPVSGRCSDGECAVPCRGILRVHHHLCFMGLSAPERGGDLQLARVGAEVLGVVGAETNSNGAGRTASTAIGYRELKSQLTLRSRQVVVHHQPEVQLRAGGPIHLRVLFLDQRIDVIGDRQKTFVRVLGRRVLDLLYEIFSPIGDQPIVAFTLLEFGGPAERECRVHDVTELVQPLPVQRDTGLLGRLVDIHPKIFHRCGDGRVPRHVLAAIETTPVLTCVFPAS